MAAWALQQRLPAIYWAREFAVSGDLMSHGSDIDVLFRRFADFVLRGSNPADMPKEQPTKFDLVVNLKSAKSLGLTVPQSLLARANEVIE
jgi:putative ABC transport system substrate-binding protein